MDNQIQSVEADGRIYVGQVINPDLRVCSYPAEWELEAVAPEPEKAPEGRVKSNLC